MIVTQAKPLLRALAGEPQTVPPVWLMRQAGRYLPEYRAVRAQVGGFLDLCYTPARAAEVTLQPIHRYGFDGAILFSDILVIPDAVGQPVTFQPGEGPVLTPLADRAAVAALSADRVLTHLAPVFETVRTLRRDLPDATTLIGFAGAPWTVATYMLEGGGSKDYQQTKTWLYGDPQGFQALMDLLVDATVRYLTAQAAAGAEAVQIFDSWAGVLADDAFRRWVIQPHRAIVAGLRAQGVTVPVIGFPRGAGVLYPEYVRETGVTAVGLDTTVPPAWAAQHIQPLVPVQGNLDPILLKTGGEALVARVRELVNVLGKGPFIFNLGHGIVPSTPPEHVELLLRTLRSPEATAS